MQKKLELLPARRFPYTASYICGTGI